MFCHEYGKIPRHTGQNPITEGDLEWILTKLLWTEWTVTIPFIAAFYFFISSSSISCAVPCLMNKRGATFNDYASLQVLLLYITSFELSINIKKSHYLFDNPNFFVLYKIIFGQNPFQITFGDGILPRMSRDFAIFMAIHL